MARRGKEIERRVLLPTVSALAGAALVQASLRTLPKYEVVTLRPGVFQATRVIRPTWAIVLACCLAPVLGLGLLFLLVRTTETCKFHVSESRGRTEVSIVGRLPLRSLDRLIATLDADSGVSTGFGGGSQEGRTTLSLARPEAPRRNAAPSQRWDAGDLGGPVVLRFDNGDVVATLAVGVVGREPASVEAYPDGVLVTVADPTRSISKSHFAFGPTDGGVWVEDLRSTNGTFVVDGSGDRSRVSPGTRVAVQIGSLIEFGDRTARLETA